MQEHDFEIIDELILKRLSIEVFNEGTSNIDFNVNIELTQDFKIANPFIDGFFTHGTETFDIFRTNIIEEIEKDTSIIEEFMKEYGNEWRSLGED